MAEPTPEPKLKQPSSWSDLPWDLSGQVLRLLQAFADRARFAAVCPQWRAAARQVSLPPALPLLALPDGTFYSLPYGKPFCFPGFGCAGYKTAACDRWLVFVRDDGCFLVDPFARVTVKLPPLSHVRLRPPNAVAKYKYVKEGLIRVAHPFTTWMLITDNMSMPIIRKLIVCSPNLVAAFIGTRVISQILLCQPGASSWSVRANDDCKMFEDMAFYQGKLYTLADNESLFIVNISQDPSTGDPQVSRVGQVIKGDPDPLFEADMPDNTAGRKKLYLVESHGSLLMVRRKVCCTLVNGAIMAGLQNEFELLEADLEHSRWVNVSTMGDDQVLFLGRPCSRVVSASQYGMVADQIFFLDDVTESENAVQYAYDEENTSVGVYNMRTGEISSPLPMVWKHEMIPATWLFP